MLFKVFHKFYLKVLPVSNNIFNIHNLFQFYLNSSYSNLLNKSKKSQMLHFKNNTTNKEKISEKEFPSLSIFSTTKNMQIFRGKTFVLIILLSVFFFLNDMKCLTFALLVAFLGPITMMFFWIVDPIDRLVFVFGQFYGFVEIF